MSLVFQRHDDSQLPGTLQRRTPVLLQHVEIRLCAGVDCPTVVVHHRRAQLRRRVHCVKKVFRVPAGVSRGFCGKACAQGHAADMHALVPRRLFHVIQAALPVVPVRACVAGPDLIFRHPVFFAQLYDVCKRHHFAQGLSRNSQLHTHPSI